MKPKMSSWQKASAILDKARERGIKAANISPATATEEPAMIATLTLSVALVVIPAAAGVIVGEILARIATRRR